MTNIEFAQALKNEMFASRDTVKEAFDYAFDIAKASDNSSAVVTAVMVLANTIAKQIVKNEKEIAQ
jgi:cation transport regulator ChaB